MTHDDLVAGLEARFEDGGKQLLAELGLSSWADLVADQPASRSPDQVLAELRDRWEREGELEASAAATHAIFARLRVERGDDHPSTLAELARLGAALEAAGRSEGADVVADAWERVVAVAPAGDVDRGRVAARLGLIRVAQDRASEAIFPLREAASSLRVADPELASEAEFRLGLAMIEFGSVEEGLRRVEASVRAARNASPPGPVLPERLSVFATLVADRLPAKDAEGPFREAMEAARRVHGDQSPEVAVAQAALADLLARSPDRLPESLGLLDVAVSLLLGSVGPADARTRATAARLVERLMDAGRGALDRRDRTLARESLTRAEDVALSVFGPADGRIARVRDLLARLR